MLKRIHQIIICLVITMTICCACNSAEGGKQTLKTVQYSTAEPVSKASPADGEQIPEYIVSLASNQAGQTLLFSTNGGFITLESNTKPIVSSDGRICFFNGEIVSENADEVNKTGLFVTDFVRESRIIADSMNDAYLCIDNDTFIYSTANPNGLHIYHYSTGETVTIIEDSEYGGEIKNFAASPGGRYVLCEMQDSLYLIAVEGEAQLILEEAATPLAVSEDGKTVVYRQKLEDEGRRYVFSTDGSENILELDASTDAELHQNRYGDDYLFITEQGQFRYANSSLIQFDSAEGIGLFGVTPFLTQMTRYEYKTNLFLYSYSCDQFAHFFYTNWETSEINMYVNGEIITYALPLLTTELQVSSDGMKAFYLENSFTGSTLYQVDINGQEIILEANCINFSLAADGQTIYFRAEGDNEEYNLYRMIIGQEPELVMENVDSYNLGGQYGEYCTVMLSSEDSSEDSGVGKAYLYAVGSDPVLLGENIRYVSPPDAFGTTSFLVDEKRTFNKELDRLAYDLYISIDGQELLLKDNLNRYSYFSESSQWYYKMPQLINNKSF